jgi:hypothetical protein
MRLATVVLLTVLIAASLSTVLRAQVDSVTGVVPDASTLRQHEPVPAERVQNTSRTVGPHQFMTNAAVPDIFPDTYLLNSLGAGMAVGLEVPVYTREEPPRQIGTLGGDLLYAALKFKYQYGINDWLGASLSFAVVSRLGTNGATLIAQGVNAATSPELGLVARLWKGESAMISANASYSKSDLTYVTPLDWARNIIDSLREGAPLDSNNTLVHDAQDMRFSLGVRYVYAFSPAFGVAAGGNFAISSLTADLTTLFGASSLGLSGECDFGKLTPVDIGLQVGLTYVSRSAINEDIAAGTVGTRIALLYTGRTDFSTGINVAFAKVQSKQSEKDFSMQIVSLVMQYDF